MDEMVQRAQRFVNETYADGTALGVAKLQEDGKTGWPVMRALTRALQLELGITSLSDAFGPTTLATLQARMPNINAQTISSANICRIIQSALYCKGYDGGLIDGVYNTRVQVSVARLKSDMGLATALPGSSLEPKVFKGLLNMDPYVLVGSGSPEIRAIQQWLNGRYLNRRDFFIIPCDGHHSRDVAKSMLFAIQYELGLADGVATGAFGPATRNGLANRPVSAGSTGVWARLFTAAMVLNARPVQFGDFTSAVAAEVQLFQDFAKLPVTGNGDFQTWASLLVSYGDQTRPGTACDGVTKITPARAATLVSAGYKYVGRYLYAASTSTLLEKQIQPGELETIKASGLRCFPIYQTWSRSAEYFSYSQGIKDAYAAIEWAQIHGFKPGTIIYFAVDYDAMDGEVTEYVIPHFRAVMRTVSESSGYGVGVYGPRNVCQRVHDAGYAATSFVSDMSSGFSGNLGYPLPTNWAFDQIQTTTLGNGAGAIEIDKNIASGRDIGQGDFDPGLVTTGLDKPIRENDKAALLQDVQSYLTSIGVPETGGSGWTDDDWLTYKSVTTTEAVNLVLGADWLFTTVARQLRIRKALVQAPVIWELRQLNPTDEIADAAVKAGISEDSSTGWGQIFAWVAIEARNYCVQNNIINGALLSTADKRNVWDLLHGDYTYNIRTAGYLTLYNAFQLGLPRPTTAIGDSDIEAILARYNGPPNPVTTKYGQDVKGLYNILESYNLLARSS